MHLVLALIAVLAVAGSAAAAESPWRTLGPDGGRVVHIAVSPHDRDLLLAATDTGLHRSTDRAANWTRVDAGRMGGVAAVGFHPGDPSMVYAAAENGLFRSTDGGAGWKAVALPGGEAPAWGVAVAPTNGQVIWVGRANGVLRSTDGGATWTEVIAGGGWAGALAIDPGDPQVVLVGMAGLIRRTADGGASWSEAAVGGSVNSIAISPVDPAIVWASTGESGLKSEDGGLTWSRQDDLPTTWLFTEVAADPVDKDVAYIVDMFSGIHRPETAGPIGRRSATRSPTRHRSPSPWTRSIRT